MTQEIAKDFVGYQNPESAEHSAFAKAKKVIAGPLIVPSAVNEKQTIAPIQGATGTELALVQGKAYRVISSVDVYFKMASETGIAAVVGDIYLPANQPIIVSTEKFSFLSSLAVSSAGIIQAVEVR